MRDQYLQAMSITRWVRRRSDPVAAIDTAVNDDKSSVDVELSVVQTPDSHMLDELDWSALAHKVADCTACDLHASRKQTIFGNGAEQSDWLIIGEAPGAEEEQTGLPFMGEAGKLLTAMLKAMKLKREQVYITNVLKCRLPENRDPLKDELLSCEGFLKRQIELVQPKIILCLGRIAAQTILKSSERIKTLRGQVHEYEQTGIPVVATYHPAYLLRAPNEKRKAWEDLQRAMAVVAGEVS